MTRAQSGWGTAVAATLFIFCLAMDQVIMPLATSAIVSDLQTHTGMIQAAIAVASLVAAPLYIAGGKLGDKVGRKRLFIIGTALFSIGPVTAALAPNVVVLIGGWSVIKALGMVLAIPASVGLLVASYPDDSQRARAFAMYGVGAVAAALVGPLAMGLSATTLSWRLPFALMVPILAVTLFLAMRSMTETEKVPDTAVDWIGTLLSFFAIAAIILGSMLGGRFGWWLARRPFTIGDVSLTPLGLSPAPWLIGLGVVLAALLLARMNHIEERGGRPLFSMKLFDNRTFSAAWIAALLGFIIAGALPFMIPVFTQQALGFSSLNSALVMVAFSTGSILLGFASGSLLQRFQARVLLQLFLLVVAAGLLWLVAAVDADATLGAFLGPMFVIGAGWGVISAQLPNIQLSTLAPPLQGEASGFAETGKELGIGLGAAVIASIMFSTAVGGFVDNVAKAIDLPLSATERTETILVIEDEALPDQAVAAVNHLPGMGQMGKEAFVEGFQVALGALITVTLLALAAASFIPRVETARIRAPDVKEAVVDVTARRL